MKKKAESNISAKGKKRTSVKKAFRRKLIRRTLPISVGCTMLISCVLWILLNECGAISFTAFENLLVFFVIPPVLAAVICLITAARIAEMMREKYDDVNDAVQRLAMGHYHRIKISNSNDEIASVYDGLNAVAGQLLEKDSRIESIGRKCDQLESDHEGETCRWLGTKVNPEMMKTVLTGIESMAREDRCEDILEVIDDAQQVIAASLEDGIALRPLADELSRIKRFLEIYETVYQRSIGYRMSIMCNIVNYRIIPNLILPVVQILFDRAKGIERDDYEIGVEVNSSFTNLLIIVRDNNGLASEDEFSYVVNDDTASRDADDGAITIGALNRRISSFYGKKYSIKLSTNKLGTAVYIYLPPVSSNIAMGKK